MSLDNVAQTSARTVDHEGTDEIFEADSLTFRVKVRQLLKTSRSIPLGIRPILLERRVS